jgi:hypothetical protein
VETALIAPVFFVLLFGILELGFLLRDYQITSDAVGDGARIGAALGPATASDGTAPDYQIMRTLRDATGSLDPDWIRRVVIFDASGPSSGLSPEAQVPAGCKTGAGITGVCNVYDDPYDAFLAVESGQADYFDCTQTPASPACRWPAGQRRAGPTVADIDHVGVWMQVQRPWVTRLFGSAITLEEAAVLRIEVGELGG